MRGADSGDHAHVIAGVQGGSVSGDGHEALFAIKFVLLTKLWVLTMIKSSRVLRASAMRRALFFQGYPMSTIFLLFASNVFMTFAWYGHLKFRDAPLWQAVMASWGIAFFEYCLMVPANRLGYVNFSGTQLKVIQEVITLIVFACFAVFYLGESFRWNHLVSFALLIGAVWFAFLEVG
jgi:hypothetical protein